MQQTSDMLRHFHVDPATEEIVLRQLEATNIISQEMLSGWLTWEPSADAAHRLAIIAGLARIKILEGAPPQLLVDVLGAAELRDRISRMSGSYCFSCTPAWNLRYQIFADKVAREFSLRGWAPMAPPQLVERQDLNSTSDQEPQSSIELNLTQIERYFISALGVDSEFAIQALIDTGFYTGDDPPYAQGGRHMQWTSKVEHAFRAALEYAQHHEISYDLTSDENYYEFLRVIRNHEP